MRICLGIAGSIAAYRSPDLLKELVARGHEVEAVPTRSALEFVSARVLEIFAGRPVREADVFGDGHRGTDHIETARWADAFIVYGATADLLSRLAYGRADDFLSLQLLAFRGPVLIAPAMNPSMWEHAAVKANVARLRGFGGGYHFVGPVWGRVACGETGYGHIASHAEILDAVEGLTTLQNDTEESETAPLDDSPIEKLRGRRALVSTGPMRTELDPVRFLQNRSSGRMGLEIAKALRYAGAEVTLLLGPVSEGMAEELEGFKVIPYTSPQDYEQGLRAAWPSSDLFVSVAAVLDFKLAASPKKISRAELAEKGRLELKIEATRDYVAWVAAERRPEQKVVAFSLETGEDSEVLDRARQKLQAKGVDAIVANPSRSGAGPESEQNRIWWIRKGAEPRDLGEGSKTLLAHRLLKPIASLF